MSHLVIQIPCHNEAANLGQVLSAIPKSIPGITRITTIVIDDGSDDGSGDIAREAGASQVVRFPRRGGVARAFVTGVEHAIAAGADLIVNLDGDNQHPAHMIPELVAPVLRGEADLVVGVRDAESLGAFSPVKRLLERLGSRIARAISGTSVSDGPSGFRAMSREAAMRLHVFNRFSYTLETLVQAGQFGMSIATVEIQSSPANRPSRVVRSNWHYVGRQGLTMVRVYMAYRPFRFFATPGLVALSLSLGLAIRYVVLFMMDGRAGRLQSLILAALLCAIGVALIVIGLVADLIAVNRRLLEEIDWRVKRMESAARAKAPDHA